MRIVEIIQTDIGPIEIAEFMVTCTTADCPDVGIEKTVQAAAYDPRVSCAWCSAELTPIVVTD